MRRYDLAGSVMWAHKLGAVPSTATKALLQCCHVETLTYKIAVCAYACSWRYCGETWGSVGVVSGCHDGPP